MAAFSSSLSAVGLSTAAMLLPTSTMEASLSTATASPHTPSDGLDDSECELLGPFALLVQVALGALALLSLVYKRCVIP